MLIIDKEPFWKQIMFLNSCFCCDIQYFIKLISRDHINLILNLPQLENVIFLVFKLGRSKDDFLSKFS